MFWPLAIAQMSILEIAVIAAIADIGK